jgi:hypothetical protein
MMRLRRHNTRTVDARGSNINVHGRVQISVYLDQEEFAALRDRAIAGDVTISRQARYDILKGNADASARTSKRS